MRTIISIAALAAAFSVATTAQAANIVETAEKAGTFNTLIAAAKAAGLAGALSGNGPLTVFAPTDEAFAKLPKGTVETLLKPENKAKLGAILSYHVVSGSITSDKIANGKSHVKTIKAKGDKTLNVAKTKSGVKVDGARVVKADVQASNGVIHVIDKVMLPHD